MREARAREREREGEREISFGLSIVRAQVVILDVEDGQPFKQTTCVVALPYARTRVVVVRLMQEPVPTLEQRFAVK